MANQTPNEWRTETPSAELGTMILVRKAASQRGNPFQSTVIPRITYRRAKRRASKAIDFKWIPEREHGFDEVLLSTCKQMPCTSKEGCFHIGCTCLNGYCTPFDSVHFEGGNVQEGTVVATILHRVDINTRTGFISYITIESRAISVLR